MTSGGAGRASLPSAQFWMRSTTSNGEQRADRVNQIAEGIHLEPGAQAFEIDRNEPDAPGGVRKNVAFLRSRAPTSVRTIR